MGARILVADADDDVRAAVAQSVRALGHVVVEASSLTEAEARVHAQPVDLVVLDLEMRGGGGLAALPALLRSPRAPAVVVAGRADFTSAIDALRAGASDYLEKPLEPCTLQAAIDRALTNRPECADSSAILGSSSAIQRLKLTLARIAAAPRTTVLITGESGAGKELVAREIHARSTRAERPFLAVNCAALAPDLLEAELFGYAPGAFTGALPAGRNGLLAAVEGGTLLLDEIGDLDVDLQAKLLRVLQERTYRPVGAHRDVDTDVRILAATNRDLSERIAAGRFRADLFYRLNVLALHVPPLRDRREDVPELAEHFTRAARARTSCPGRGPSHAALERLVRHDWPGNVRELENVIERAVLEARGRAIEPPDLEFGPSRGDLSRNATVVAGALPSGDLTLRSLEKAHIERVLAQTGNNRARAARLLGIHRATLYQKIDALGLSRGKEAPEVV